ncbi:MAG: hypothetical protein WBF17_24395, partial [Phycisphaerae bacterium]
MFAWLLAAAVLAGGGAFGRPGAARADVVGRGRFNTVASLRLAVEDLARTFGPRYPKARAYLGRLAELERAATRDEAWTSRLEALRTEALLDNPLMRFDKLLVVRSREFQMPENFRSNIHIRAAGYDADLAVLSPVGPQGTFRTIHRPPDAGGPYVGQVDLHWDADRLLVTSTAAAPGEQGSRRGLGRWRIFELRLGHGATLASPPRAVLRDQPADVAVCDACYLPNGKIVFGSTAPFQGIPCQNGVDITCSLYLTDADGRHVRRLCYDQDNDLYPAVLGDGRVIFSRWDYTGIRHEFLRPLMVMNPDGTGQRALYGGNSWWPGALYFPRPVPGEPHSIAAVVTGHHARRPGNLVLLDTARGTEETDGAVQIIPGRGQPVRRVLTDKEHYPDKPLFLHPWPLSGKHFLVAGRLGHGGRWGIYLVDVFDNIVPVHEDADWHLLEPIPLRPRPMPPVIPDQVDLRSKDATVYLHDVYAGPGMAGVPRGTVKRLRVVGYHYCYHGLGGPNEIGLSGPWEVMRILGTVGVEADGSALFRVPANTALAVQPLDAEGKAVQLMRSWLTAMPGEKVACYGCHERQSDVAPVRSYGHAAGRAPADITPWRGPPRGFSFHREVRPVLDRYCVGCHDGRREPGGRMIPDLRAREQVSSYEGFEPAVLIDTLRPHRRYGPAYEALHNYIRRPGAEDDVSRLRAAEYHADTSELVQMLRKGHHGVRLDGEGWDRLITWIDLNGPAFGTWGEVEGGGRIAASVRRRRELQAAWGGPTEDPEAIPRLPRVAMEPVAPMPTPRAKPPMVHVAGWPFDAVEARRRQALRERTVDLGGGVTIKLVWVPAGA